MYGGSCLANSTIQLSTSSQKGSVGQASFDYASTLYTDSDIFYGVIADYQGSHLCKLAPSEGVLQVRLKFILLSMQCVLKACTLLYVHSVVRSPIAQVT